MSNEKIVKLMRTMQEGIQTDDMGVLSSATFSLVDVCANQPYSNLPTRDLCFDALLEVGHYLARRDSLLDVVIFFQKMRPVFKAEPDKLQKIALARLDVVDEAIARQSSQYRIISFLCDPQFIDVAELTRQRKSLTALSLFEMTERLFDLKDKIDTDDRPKWEPLAMAASALEAYAPADSLLRGYAFWLRKDANDFVSGQKEMPHALRRGAQSQYNRLKMRHRPDAAVQAAFENLRNANNPLRTQFYEVTFKKGAGEGGASTKPLQKRSSSYAL